MRFRIEGLDPAPFKPLFALDDSALAARGIERMIVDESPSTPCRVALEDAQPGDEVLLLPHAHLAGDSPYAATGPVFVGRRAVEHASDALRIDDAVPDVLARRLLSIRAYDERARMREADVCEGTTLVRQIERFLAKPDVAFLHVHFARPGCYAARITRRA